MFGKFGFHVCGNFVILFLSFHWDVQNTDHDRAVLNDGSGPDTSRREPLRALRSSRTWPSLD
jgi:hypothetical protein